MTSFQTITLSPKRRRSIAIWLTVALGFCIAVLTLIPLDGPEGLPGGDKVHHVFAFMVLTLPSAALYPRALVRVVAVAMLYGAFIEIVQLYVGRSSEPADFFASLIGIGIGAVIGYLLHWLFNGNSVARFLKT